MENYIRGYNEWMLITKIAEKHKLDSSDYTSHALHMHGVLWQIHLNTLNVPKPAKAISSNKICIEFG